MKSKYEELPRELFIQHINSFFQNNSKEKSHVALLNKMFIPRFSLSE
ncbi:MAG: hypothetical protein H0U57_05450 [Tatlockia sp.]|nr:hypothetical protein [Tatlockia sp.]